MTKQPVDLLNTPGFFLCERSQCILKVEVCLKRQRFNQSKSKNRSGSFDICVKCEQGRENKLFSMQDSAIPELRQKSAASAAN